MSLKKDFSERLCHLLTAVFVGGWAVHAGSQDVGGFIELAVPMTTLALAFWQDRRSEKEKILRRVSAQIAADDKWLYEKFENSAQVRFNVDEAVKEFNEIVFEILPTAEECVESGLDPETVAELLLRRAAEQRSCFVDAPDNEIQRAAFKLIVGRALAALRGDEVFRAEVDHFFKTSVLAGLKAIKGDTGTILDRIESLQKTVESIGHERDVPEAPLRAVLDKLGISGVVISDIPRELSNAADEFLRLRAELGRLRNDRPEFAVIRQRALGLVNKGEFEAARAELRKGRNAAREIREEVSRSEAEFLVDEARVDRLQLNYDEACKKLADALHLDPDKFWVWVELGDLWVTRGSLVGAEKAFRAATEAARRSDDERDLSVSYNKIGDVLVAQGNLPEALKSFRDGLSIADRLAKSDQGNAGWQRDLSVSYERMGDVLVAQGNLPEALKSFQASHDIFDRLAKSDQGNAGWQRDLSVSYAKLADAHKKANDPVQAKEALTAGRAIIARLVDQFPDWAEWKRDLAWFDAQIAAFGN